MAYTYKTVGTSGAVVATLLAFGASLWYQRTPGPINAPRPQYEAAIMHATLERAYGIGRGFSYSKTYYGDTNGAWVESWSPLRIYSSEQIAVTSGAVVTWYDVLRDAYSFCAWTSGKEMELNAYIINEVAGGEDYYLTDYGFPAYLVSSSEEVWQNTPPDMHAYPIGFGGGVGVFNVMQTSQQVYTIYNTIGFFPNATFKYPADIRGLIPSRDLGAAGRIDWLVPPNSFFTSGATDYTWGAMPTNLLSTEAQWWTNRVTLPIGGNTWIPDGGDPAQFTGTNFAFERNQSPYYWSTNTYNDLARPLSAMQWQTDSRPQHRKTSVTRWFGVTASTGHETGPTGFWDTDHAGWGSGEFTNAPDENSTSIPLRSPGVTAGPYDGMYFYASRYDHSPDGGWGLRAYIYCRHTYLEATNDIPFALTNGQFWVSVVTNFGNGTNPVPASLAAFAPGDGGIYNPQPLTWSCPVGGMVTSSNICRITDSEWSDACTAFSNAAMSLITSNNYVGTGLVETGLTNWTVSGYTYDYSTIPSYRAFTGDVWRATYRPVFESLTNYLNHAPAR